MIKKTNPHKNKKLSVLFKALLIYSQTFRLKKVNGNNSGNG